MPRDNAIDGSTARQVSTSPLPRPGSDWLRENASHFHKDAPGGFDALIDALQRDTSEAEAFAGAMTERATGSPIPADSQFHTEFFPGGAEIEAAIEAAVPFLDSPATLAFFKEFLGSIPHSVSRDPRIGLAQAYGEDIPGYPNILEYRCALTRRKFALPKGAAAPCIFYDWSSDESGEPFTLIFHPLLLVAGEDHIRWALYSYVRNQIYEAAELLRNAVELLTLYSEPAPRVDPEAVALAFQKFSIVQDEDARVERYVPSGWYDVPKVNP